MNDEKKEEDAPTGFAAANGAIKIRDAARLMGVSVALVRSWLNDPEKRALYVPNAFKGGSGALTSPWFFPLGDVARYNEMIRSGQFSEGGGNIANA